MKKIISLTFIVFAFLFGNLTNAQTTTVEKEQQLIKEVIQSAYVEGLQNEGNVDKIDKGFHPAFNLLGIGKGDQIWSLPIYTWREMALADVESGKKPKTDEGIVTVNFLSVDVTGTAAVVKLEFLVDGQKKYIDYMSLYKFESGWKIVNKIFYKFPEEEK